MRINTRFPVAVHILAMIGFHNEGRSTSDLLGSRASELLDNCTSELLGKSVSTNPVVIRRISGLLKKAGLIDIKAGVGGASLRRAPENISLRDVYRAVQSGEDFMVFDVHAHPNPACFIGANINAVLARPLAEAQEAMEDNLASYSIRDIMDGIREKCRMAR